MKRKINRYFRILSAISIVITTILAGIIFQQIFHQEIQAELQHYLNFLAEREGTGSTNIENLQAASEYTEYRVTLIQKDGTVVFDSGPVDTEQLENHKDRPEVKKAWVAGKGQAYRYSDTMGKKVYSSALRLSDGSVLRVEKESISIWKVFYRAAPYLALIILAVFLFGSYFSHFLTKRLLLPIETMVKDMENGEEVKAYDEFVPFIQTIKQQHEDILKSAKQRQEFTANVSHELKTPLTSISGYSELIENGMVEGEDVVRSAGQIRQNATRLLTLINDIIRLSELDGMEDVEYENVNLLAVAEECVKFLELSAKQHGIEVFCNGEPCTIKANHKMMEELIYNLCDNAIRYNNEGGSVFVRVTQETKGILVSVKDTGIGIPEKYQERIFERFYRVDKSRSKSTGGTGLGLAIVKHIVAQHNAGLKVISASGKGTEIQVWFSV